MGTEDTYKCMYIYIYVYIYMVTPPLESLPFSWAKGGTIYIYISMFWKFRFCFERRGV